MKTICVPKGSLAQNHLDINQSQPGELIELNIDYATFDSLWKAGLFQSINKLTNSNIDDYEDERISKQVQLMKVLNSNLFDKKLYHEELHQILGIISDLFNKAITYHTGVYFFF